MKSLREPGLLFVLSITAALLAFCFNPRRAELSWTQPVQMEATLAELMQGDRPVLWVDARNAAAYELAHIPGALSLTEENWDQQFPLFLAAWSPRLRVVVYCNSESCDASQAVARRLRNDLNETDIRVLKGGWSTWLKEHP